MFGWKKVKSGRYEFSLNLITAKITLMWVAFALLLVLAFCR